MIDEYIIPPAFLVAEDTPTPANKPPMNSLDGHSEACRAYVDFQVDPPAAIPWTCPIALALAEMWRLQRSTLLVTQDIAESPGRSIVGLISEAALSRQLNADLQAALRPSCVTVVMTPWEEIPHMHIAALASLKVADLHELLQGTGIHHALVVEQHATCGATCRGLLSRGHLSQALTRPTHKPQPANSSL